VPTPRITPTPSPVATPKPASTGPDHLDAHLVVGGLVDPIGVTNAGDGSGRLFVVQRSGQVRVVNPDGSLRGAPFLDMSGSARFVSGGEQGLLGLAFHPSFAANGRVFVDYTRGDGSGAWEDVVSELTASPDRSTASAGSERMLLVVADPYSNHNGGQLAFGPDGYLYIAMGDGGSGGDPHGNGQNRQALLGKILRIDVNGAHVAGKEYAIPSSNPYASGGISPGAGLPEIWAYGLRNPWRFSFDRANGDLYIGDVGQNMWEEVDRQAGGSRGGQNYGWNAFEGSHCFQNCAGVSYIPPIAEYSHASGCSVTGGYVYRGAAQAALKGFYVFSDYCSGTLWTFPAGAGSKAMKVVASTGRNVTSFGESEAGELYLVDITSGGLYKVVIGS
jgi:glucose/arabinose dehydrogenase